MPLPVSVQRMWIGADLWIDSNGNPLVGKKLSVTPTTQRMTDSGAGAVIIEAPAVGTVDSDGKCWVKGIATDDPDLNPDQFTLAVSEPGGTGYFMYAPATGAPTQTHDDGTGAVALPTIDLSQDIQRAPAPLAGQVQTLAGRGITSAAITGGHLIVTYEDGSTEDAGAIAGSGAVSSVNGHTGTVVLAASDVSAIAASAVGAASGVAPLDATSKVPTANLPTFTGAVTSVNTKTGAVVLAASDVGAVDTALLGADNGVATLDAGGFVPAAQLPSISGAVSSVNTLTGNVVLTTGNTGFVATTDSRLGYLYTARPVNARNTGNPLADAVMDGSSHALSTRFADLASAQAVFPACTALTEEIDYYAIQTLLNNSGSVYIPQGTAVLHKSLLLKAGGNQTVAGAGTGATVLFLKSGSNSNVISPADQTNSNPNVTLRDFTVDGNKAGNTGAIGQTDNILLTRCDNLTVLNVESRNANGRGIHHHGLTGTTCSVQTWRDIYVHDNLHWGLHNSNGVRQVDYANVKAINNGLRTDISLTQTGNGADNFTGGFLLDHSEVTVNGLQTHLNGQDGLWIRNAFSCNLSNVWATRNGRHGIRVLGLVDSAGDSWVSQGNGTNVALVGHDIWFDGTASLNYGVTARTRLGNIEAGPNRGAAVATQGSWSGNEDYAIYFDDNMTNSDLETHAKLYAGTVGTVRLPAAGLGSMFYSDGPTALEKVNSVTTSGTAQTIPDVNVATLNRYVLTASTCAFTLPPVGAGKSLTVSLVQDATGGRGYTWLPTGGVIKWAGGTAPTPTPGAGQVDVVAFLCIDGTHWLAFVMGQGL